MPSAIPSKNIAVIGAGAIGCVFAQAAGALGHATTLCVRRAEREFSVQRNDVCYPLKAKLAGDPHALAPADWVVIATKAQDTLSIAPWLSRLVDQDTKLLLLQNGIDGVNLVRSLVQGNPVLPSVVYINAERSHSNVVIHHFGSHIEVPEGEAAAELQALMCGGIDVRPQEDFTTSAWRKLIINIVVNPITALTVQRFGVFAVPEIRGLAAGLIHEAAAVGNANGAQLSQSDIDTLITTCANLKPQGGTSMLYDRLMGKRLEIEYLTGTIVRLAQQSGIPVPLNTAILALLRAVDKPAGPLGPVRDSSVARTASLAWASMVHSGETHHQPQE